MVGSATTIIAGVLEFPSLTDPHGRLSGSRGFFNGGAFDMSTLTSLTRSPTPEVDTSAIHEFVSEADLHVQFCPPA